jgi:ligand-binding SRPBCC domain-containing protein
VNGYPDDVAKTSRLRVGHGSSLKKENFTKQSVIRAPARELFEMHCNRDALSLITPEWVRLEVLDQPERLELGSRFTLKASVGPFRLRWHSEITEYVEGCLFADIQLKGPFAVWYHRHLFEPNGTNETLYIDEIEYALPLGWPGRLVAGGFVRGQLDRLFSERHRKVAEMVKIG